MISFITKREQNGCVLSRNFFCAVAKIPTAASWAEQSNQLQPSAYKFGKTVVFSSKTQVCRERRTILVSSRMELSGKEHNAFFVV